MSSIRIFILDAFERHGEMHGHQLKAYADHERVSLWTDISTSGIYQAVKRLCNEGLLAPTRLERVGNFPQRQIFAITQSGSEDLLRLKREAFRDIVMRPDPFDLALTRASGLGSQTLSDVIEARVASMRDALEEREALHRNAQPYLTPIESVALTHRAHVLRADIAWHEALLTQLPHLDLKVEANLQPWEN